MSTLSEIFESLRHRAEEFTSDAADTRRPSWAPALVVNDEFIQLVRGLGLLLENDKPIVRLWAKFADPRVKGTLLRQQVGLTLEGVRCRAFDLHVGMKRKGPKLFWAKRGDDALWEQGSQGWKEWGDYKFENLQRRVRELKRSCAAKEELLRGDLPSSELRQHWAAQIEQAQRELAEIEPGYKAAQEALDARNNKIARLLVLARERVIEFGGGDHLTQMVAGARVSGHCCICGKELTDPTSIERGIGPDCYSQYSKSINAWVAKQRTAA
jgi:uncharacterized protein DUF6011